MTHVKNVKKKWINISKIKIKKYIKFKNIKKPFYVVSGPNGEEYAWYQCTVSLFYLFA